MHAATGEYIAIEFDRTIQSIRQIDPEPDPLYIAPGFIDLQVNGFVGVDFNSPADLSTCRAVDAMLATGVTRCLPTVITGPRADMHDCLRKLRSAMLCPRGRMIAGFHVEGPHIGPEDGARGAHPAKWVRPPDLDEFAGWQEATDGNIRLVTMSPHWPDAPDYIAAVVRAGVVVSIGHTSATKDQIAAAIDAGATLSTHLGNAAPRLMPKFPNLLFDQLAEDRLNASLIVDGHHLDDAFLRVAVRAKGIERTILITDAAAPAAMPPGKYRLGELDVELTPDGRVVLDGSSKLAGSALRMDRAISNLMRIANVPLADAIQTATINPARLIHLDGRMQGLVPGDRADLVMFRKNARLEIEAVYLDGERVI